MSRSTACWLAAALTLAAAVPPARGDDPPPAGEQKARVRGFLSFENLGDHPAYDFFLLPSGERVGPTDQRVDIGGVLAPWQARRPRPEGHPRVWLVAVPHEVSRGAGRYDESWSGRPGVLRSEPMAVLTREAVEPGRAPTVLTRARAELVDGKLEFLVAGEEEERPEEPPGGWQAGWLVWVCGLGGAGVLAAALVTAGLIARRGRGDRRSPGEAGAAPG
jgi:hypothetical protein